MRRLIAWVAAAFAPAIIGLPFTARAPQYYRALDKPGWSPPSSAFGPVWTVLYLLIGVSGWLVAQRTGSGGAQRLWGLQLALNAAWTPLFFGLRRPGMALVEIMATLAAIVLTVAAFFRQRRLAGVLLLPYLAWVAFATALNAAIWRRNRR
ncbi:MAG TPA: TspO/MBR family protein [candidate division Zixibacteria bacterium]|nr:TspO/MBR family protein [candidate division Zixibacteria bacterium]